MNNEAGAGWERTATNRLRRITHSPSGMVTTETVDTESRLRNIWEKYPDALRKRYVYGEIEPSSRILQETLRKAGYLGVEINLLDSNEQFVSKILIPNADIIKVDLYQDRGKGFEVLDSPDALVSLQYDRGEIKKCTLQSDVSYIEVSNPNVEGADWRQTLPLLLNYIRTTIPEELDAIRTANEIALTDFIENELPSSNHPFVSKVRQISDQLIAHILNSIPFEDQDETNRLLASIKLREFLDESLLTSLVDQQIDVNSIEDMQLSSPDRYLDQQLKFAIWMVESDPVYQAALLVLEDFSEKGFAYHQVEKDFDGSQVLPTNPGGLFGSDIDIYGNKFLVTKVRDSIIIDCNRNGNRRGWEASFPLTIPADQIINTGTNPEGDFRQVRSLLNFSLKEQK